MRETPESVKHRLGEPLTTITARFDPTSTEWIYPTYGLTITVGTYDDPDDAPDRITYLFLYAPTTLEHYVSELGGKDEWVRRWPQRR
jgi:hypothetical protein